MATIKELIANGVRKATQADWPHNEWLELPQIDPYGSVSESIRLVVENAGIYFNVNEFSGNDYVQYEEEYDDIDMSNLNTSISFEQAKDYVLKFGPPEFRGLTLDRIATYNDGLRYLDFVVGQPWLHADTRDHIIAYLSNNGIKRDLENLT